MEECARSKMATRESLLAKLQHEASTASSLDYLERNSLAAQLLREFDQQDSLVAQLQREARANSFLDQELDRIREAQWVTEQYEQMRLYFEGAEQLAAQAERLRIAQEMTSAAEERIRRMAETPYPDVDQLRRLAIANPIPPRVDLRAVKQAVREVLQERAEEEEWAVKKKEIGFHKEWKDE